MSLQARNICSRHYEYYAPVCSVPSPRVGCPVRNWTRPSRQRKSIACTKQHLQSVSCRGRLLALCPGFLMISGSSTRQHDGDAGTVTSQMAQAPASQQQDAIKVAVFTTVGCPHCKRAKGILQEENVAYEEIDVSTDTKLRQELQNITGQGTVPQARV